MIDYGNSVWGRRYEREHTGYWLVSSRDQDEELTELIRRCKEKDAKKCHTLRQLITAVGAAMASKTGPEHFKGDAALLETDAQIRRFVARYILDAPITEEEQVEQPQAWGYHDWLAAAEPGRYR
ncbi:hypothetical protein DL770_001029 [Monosporascus sp. CRB-9-2]|nr:hypothetical protein DL770_001029 [Monosporascus sp. CRB-9-2]